MQARPGFFHVLWARGELDRLVSEAERKQAMVKHALATGYRGSYIRNRAQLKQYVNNALSFSGRYPPNTFALVLLTRLGKLALYVDALYGVRRSNVPPLPAAPEPSRAFPPAPTADSLVNTNVVYFRANDAPLEMSSVMTLPQPFPGVTVTPSARSAPFLRRSVARAAQAAKPRRKRPRPKADARREDDEDDDWFLSQVEDGGQPDVVTTPPVHTPTWQFDDAPFVSDELDELAIFQDDLLIGPSFAPN